MSQQQRPHSTAMPCTAPNFYLVTGAFDTDWLRGSRWAAESHRSVPQHPTPAPLRLLSATYLVGVKAGPPPAWAGAGEPERPGTEAPGGLSLLSLLFLLAPSSCYPTPQPRPTSCCLAPRDPHPPPLSPTSSTPPGRKRRLGSRRSSYSLPGPLGEPAGRRGSARGHRVPACLCGEGREAA